jgi:hypothetical protein
MQVTVLHDEHGQIVAMANIADRAEAGSKFDRVGMVPGPGQRILDVELSDDDAGRPLAELHQDYRVDLATSTLARKE